MGSRSKRLPRFVVIRHHFAVRLGAAPTTHPSHLFCPIGQRCGSDRAEGEWMSESQFPHMLLLKRMQVLSRSIITVVISSSLACAAARFRYGGGDDSQPRCAARYAWASTAAPSTRPPGRPPRRSEDRSPRQQQLEVPLNPPTPPGSRPPSCVHRADSQQPAQAHPLTPPTRAEGAHGLFPEGVPTGRELHPVPSAREWLLHSLRSGAHSLSTAATHEPLPAKVNSLACLLAARRFPQRRRGFCLARSGVAAAGARQGSIVATPSSKHDRKPPVSSPPLKEAPTNPSVKPVPISFVSSRTRPPTHQAASRRTYDVRPARSVCTASLVTRSPRGG